MNENTRLNLCNQLGTYLFENVWNAPHSEYRQNFIPKVISSIPRSGAIQLKGTSVPLPTSDSFYVYAIAKCCLAGIIIGSKNWIKVSDYINSKPFDMRFHGTDGEYLYRDLVFMKDHPYEDMVLIAIEKKMMRSILGTAYNFKKIFFAVYYDSDDDQTMDSSYFKPRTQEEISTAYNSTRNSDIVFINGRESTLQTMGDIKIGDYVETINDPDIVADFVTDLTDRDGSRIYRSEVNACFKYIIHIPKANNPDNLIITHNTCDFFIRPKNVPNAHLKGLFIHRCYPVMEGISQITHNDFGIPEPILTGYLTRLDTTEVEIRCVARTHRKTRKMVAEANYITWLYRLEDNVILDFLESASRDLSFWNAKHLEKSLFIKMLFITPECYELSALEEYIETLGYFNTIALLCARVQRYTITSSLTRRFNIPIPLTLRKSKLKANLFIDGLKIRDERYTTSSDGEYLTYNVDAGIPFNTGMDLVTELFETPPFYAEIFTPNSNAHRQLVTGEFKLYRVRSTESDTFIGDFFSNEETFDYTYDLLPETEWENYGELITDGEYRYFDFNADCYGFTYMFISKQYFQRVYHHLFDIVDLNTTTLTFGPVTLDTREFTSNAPITVPVPHDGNFVAYMNGRELIPGVDYSIIRKTSITKNMVYTWIHIQNVSYLNPTNNCIDVYVTGDAIYGSASDFIHEDKMLTFDPIIYWREALAMMAVDGKTMSDLYFDNGYLSVEEGSARAGAIAFVRAICPITIKEFVDIYSADGDVARITAILEYFREFAAPIPPIEVLPQSHRVYSVLTNQVLHDALTGQLSLAYDSDANRMLSQIPQYLDLREGDVVFQYTCGCKNTVTTNPDTICSDCGGAVIRNLNLRYIDILPSYRLNETYNTDLYAAMLQLMRALFPEDKITDGDNVNVE